jgi:chemosensory pili system protein ChpA (sensor histidine kinase/response regulator)
LCDRDFAFHLNEIERIARLNPEEIDESSVRIAGDKLPLIEAGQILGLRNYTRDEDLGKAILLIVEGEGKRGAIRIDGLLDRQDMVFKDLGSHLRRVRFISGVTVTGDGKLVPILNPYELLEAETDMVEARPFAKAQATKTALDILIADDSVSVRRVLSTFIKEQGWNPITAKDGVDALEMVREMVPDLILLDIEMPRMNGFEVLQALKAQPALQHIPVLILTSRAASKYQDKSESLGAQGYVTKPYKEEELISLITSLTGSVQA